MAHTFVQKIHLLVDFLLGARLTETHSALVRVGWSTERLQHGWRLVEQAGQARFSGAIVADTQAGAQLLAFKQRWFPVARVTLRRRSPTVLTRLVGSFDSRTQASASFIVESFLNVLDELEGSSLASERADRELLRERGLTAELVTSARALIEQARALIATKAPPSFIAAEERAEEELWNFYLEWSELARCSIANRTHLRRLGLNRVGRPAHAPKGPDLQLHACITPARPEPHRLDAHPIASQSGVPDEQD